MKPSYPLIDKLGHEKLVVTFSFIICYVSFLLPFNFADEISFKRGRVVKPTILKAHKITKLPSQSQNN